MDLPHFYIAELKWQSVNASKLHPDSHYNIPTDTCVHASRIDFSVQEMYC